MTFNDLRFLGKDHEAIISFLRSSFDGGTGLISDELDWSRILQDSSGQGVAALIFDGIQKVYDTAPGSLSSLEQQRTVKYDLLGQCLQTEKDYSSQWGNARMLAEQMDAEGIRLYVLKGFALSSFYPIPEHRPCCDLDCYLLSDGKPAYGQGNRIAAKLGYRVKAFYYKHSKIRVGSLTVENHRCCLPIKGDPRSKRLNDYLLSIIEDGSLRYIGDSKLLSPAPMFNAVYVLAHAREHFFNERITLRHICDWGCLLHGLGSEGEDFWNEWKTVCSSFGLLGSGYSMSRLVGTVCGIRAPFQCPADPGVDRKVLEDVFRSRGKKKTGLARRVQLVRSLLSSQWKFRAFSDRSALGFTLRRVCGYLFEKDPE